LDNYILIVALDITHKQIISVKKLTIEVCRLYPEILNFPPFSLTQACDADNKLIVIHPHDFISLDLVNTTVFLLQFTVGRCN